LHRDISENNIIITDPGEADALRHRTGTMHSVRIFLTHAAALLIIAIEGFSGL
jgi:hypothetical protein